MVLVRAKNAHIHVDGGVIAPPDTVEVSDTDAKVLIGLGVAELVDGEVSEDVVEGDGSESEPGPSEPEPVVAEPSADAVEAVDGEDDPDQEMLDVFEALTADDFVKNGPRAGRPKVQPIADALEREVTAEEIDAVWAKREAASQG